MKHIFNQWQIAFFCLTIALITMSCQKEDTLQTSPTKRIVMSGNRDWRNIPYEELDETYFQTMCAERPELVEIPRYMSEFEIDSLIEVIEDMNADEYMRWYNSYPYQNSIFDSYLFYETMLSDLSYSTLGDHIDNLDEITDAATIETLASDFIDALENSGSTLYTTIQTTSGKTLYQPIDNIDISAFTDALGQIIIEYTYYRYIDNVLISMPLTTYMEVPMYTPTSDIANSYRNFLEQYGFDEGNGDFSITILPQTILSPIVDDPATATDPTIYRNATLFINNTNSDYHFMAYSDDGLYGSMVRLYSYEKHKRRANHRYAYLCIENYVFPQNSSKGVSTKRVHVNATISYKTIGTDNSDRTWTHNFSINKKFRKRTEKDEVTYNASEPIDSNVQITNVSVNMSWNNNVVELTY